MRELGSDRGKSRVNRLVREVRGRLGRCKREPQAYQLELAESILIRHSNADDEVALRQLAALDSRTLPKRSFLLAEINGELVAAARRRVLARWLTREREYAPGFGVLGFDHAICQRRFQCANDICFLPSRSPS
jgi:hypothetical protein